MLVPLYDTEPNRYTRWPIMVTLLILLNVLMYAGELYLFEHLAEDQLIALVMEYALVPRLLWLQEGSGLISTITHMFLHSSFLHILFNMWALWVFGRRVEDACGPIRFLLFYVCCGLIAAVFAALVNPASMRPAIGASGAVFGIEGAYLLLYPSGRIRTFFLLGPIPLFIRIPSFIIVLLDLPLQLIPAFDVLFNQGVYGTAYWAHLGGFFGSLVIIFFLRPVASQRFWRNLPI